MATTSPSKRDPEEGVHFLGESIKEENGKTWYGEVELEPLKNSRAKENFRVRIGDDVLVDNDDYEHDWVVRVTELFADPRNKEAPGRFKGRWFYRIEDTLLMVSLAKGEPELPLDDEIGRREGLEGRRVWLAEEEDSEDYVTENALGAIERLARVKHVNPGDPVPKAAQCDFWFNQTHSRKFYTFKDLYKTPKAAERPQPIRRLNVLDLFCGCGGLSFLDQKRLGVEIKTTHAVDMDDDALRTYQTNNPDVTTHLSSVEEFLFLCKHFDRLAARLEIPREVEFSPSKRIRLEQSVEVIKISSMELGHSVGKMKDGQSRGQLKADLTMENSWLIFTCLQKNGNEVCLKEADVLQNPNTLRSFVMSCSLPRPGDIQVIVGGPPCQGVSCWGLSSLRQAYPRNRLVKSFFRTIEFFRPEFALMENVQDIMRKEDGAYAKYATAQLLALGYQSRLGVIAAATVAVLLMGSTVREGRLASIPSAGVSYVVPDAHLSQCQVGFISEKDRTDAYPMVLNEDVITDLPEVSNFSLADSAKYKSDPLRPVQAWLRRLPDENALDLQTRATRADAEMAPVRRVIQELVASKEREARGAADIPVKVADIVQCQLGETRKNDFATEVRQIYLQQIKEGPDAEKRLKDIEDRKTAMLREHGQALLDALREIDAVACNDPSLVRDHRPRVCNSDDFFRITQVPNKPGQNFRNMPGVTVNSKGTCCAGHSHAFIGHGCPGGGTAPLPKRSVQKESRIDHSDKDGWRVCPRWCITYKNGLSNGRHGCFGRIRLDDVQPTVVTRAEPHNLEICHPFQDRVLSIREMARCQGFPDYYVFVGTEKDNSRKRTVTRLRSIENRYKQIGNAVAPPVAAALGRCLVLAASGQLQTSDPVVRTIDEEMAEVLKEAQKSGLVFYRKELGEVQRTATHEAEERASSDEEASVDLQD